jgi:outer membrane protein assembly factor BamB
MSIQPSLPKRITTGLALAFTLLLASAASADWSQFRGGPQQVGIAGTELPPKLELAWTFTVADGIESTAAITKDTVFVGGLGGTFHALDLATGEERWRFEGGEEIKSSPLVADGTVYFGDEAGRLHALDAATGKERFTVELDGAISGSANLGAGCILFGAYDNFIYCVSPEDGTIRWKKETDGYVHGTPALTEDGRVASSGCDGFLRLLDAKTGEEVAKIEMGGYVAASPAVRGERLYVGTFESEVLAVDLAKGAVAWRYENPEREFPYYSSAAVSADRVVIGGRDKMVHAIDPQSGEKAWTHAFRARVDASPVIAGEHVYVADLAGKILALALADGKVLWEYDTGDGFLASPAVAHGRLVLGTEGGTLYTFASGSQK